MSSPKVGGILTNFAKLVDASLPWKDGIVVMLKAYFDASTRAESGVFCVAGVALTSDGAKLLEQRLNDVFGKRRCHMTDLHARKGAFAGIDDSEAGSLCRGAIAAINECALAVATISCDVAEVTSLIPTNATPDAESLADTMRGPYNTCLHWTMMVMGRMFDLEPPQRIQYWFEMGDEFQGAARRFLAVINGHQFAEPLRRSYAYGSDVFAAKADVVPFDAADVVAWEWRKHVERIRANQKVRPSLTALMNGSCTADGQAFHNTNARYGNHFTGASLRRYFDKMGAVMRATSVEEIELAVQRGSSRELPFGQRA